MLAFHDRSLELPSPLDRASVDKLRDDHAHQVWVADGQSLLLGNGSLPLLEGCEIIEGEGEEGVGHRDTTRGYSLAVVEDTLELLPSLHHFLQHLGEFDVLKH